MLNFILYNPIFEILLIIPFIINILTISILDCKQSANTTKKTPNSTNITLKIQIKIILIVSILMSILIFNFFAKYLFTIILLVTMIVSLVKTIIDIYFSDDTSFTLDNKYYNTFATIFFITFFASYVIPIYITSFQNLNHFIKEILLLLFINLKLTLFVFLLLINISVLISNITEILNQKQKNFLTKIFCNKSKSYKIIHYNFFFYNKNMTKKNLIIDTIIYTILSPITILLNFTLVIILKLLLKFKNIITYLINKFNNYKKYRNLITKKITYISIIISLSITYIIIIMNDNLFMNTTNELFSYFSTVILIPLIYDCIKNN